MLRGLKRIKSVAHSYLVRLLTPASGSDRSAATDQELLEAIWEALNIARDNKALVVAREGIIININQLACQLCGSTRDQLVGRSVARALFEDPLGPQTGATAERWET